MDDPAPSGRPAIARFYAFPKDKDAPANALGADWNLELDAVCSPKNERWQFTLKRAVLNTKFGFPTAARFIELDEGTLRNFLRMDTAGDCEGSDGTELSLKLASASHYSNGRNADVNRLIERGVYEIPEPPAGSCPPPSDGPPSCEWFRRNAVLAHELQHYRRFKYHAQQGFREFVDGVEKRILIPVREGDTVESVLASVDIRRLRAEWIGEITESAISAGELIRGARQGEYEYVHANPDDFYNCSVNALMPVWNVINASRTTYRCGFPANVNPLPCRSP